MPITIDGTNGITQANEFNSDSTFGFKNRIINGAMVIDQRNAGSAKTLSSSTYTLDRWSCVADTSTGSTVQQVSTAPTGFINSLKWTTGTGGSPSSAALNWIYQVIEGLNCTDLAWGTASAKTVTISFWVRSSLTGTFGGSLANGSLNYSYPFTYTISVADTWEYKTITIAGPTSGTWTTSNTAGIYVFLDMGMGSNYRGTAGSWAGSWYAGATGDTNVIGTTSATFYITGVQLEVGSTATSFDYRPYGTELALCQRYYYRVAPTLGNPFGSCAVQATNAAEVSIYFPVTMRTTPTALEQSGTANQYAVYTGGGVNASNAVPTFNWASQHIGVPQFNFASVLTVGRAGTAYASSSSGGYLAWSAEL